MSPCVWFSWHPIFTTEVWLTHTYSIAVVQGSFFFFGNILIRMVTDVINCYILESRSSEFATTIGGWLQIGRALETAALQAVALWFPKAGLRPGPGLGWYLS